MFQYLFSGNWFHVFIVDTDELWHFHILSLFFFGGLMRYNHFGLGSLFDWAYRWSCHPEPADLQGKEICWYQQGRFRAWLVIFSHPYGYLFAVIFFLYVIFHGAFGVHFLSLDHLVCQVMRMRWKKGKLNKNIIFFVIG